MIESGMKFAVFVSIKIQPMKKKLYFNFVIITVLITLSGCAVIADAREARDGNPNPHLIRDCPERKIHDGGIMTNEPKGYYIYQGQRRELREFDNEWITIYCDVEYTRYN
ncbi:MAG: hypothetical protein GQ574_09735 [Crocinitomix sp.]|nr:hypothetical protein [Crocinitomix sp.]